MASEEERRKREGSFPLRAKSVGEKEKKREKRKKGAGKEKQGRKEEKRGREEKERISRCSDSRSSTVRELKLVQATRATHGY